MRRMVSVDAVELTAHAILVRFVRITDAPYLHMYTALQEYDTDKRVWYGRQSTWKGAGSKPDFLMLFGCLPMQRMVGVNDRLAVIMIGETTRTMKWSSGQRNRHRHSSSRVVSSAFVTMSTSR